jgi:hypothetical protein
LKKGLDSQRGEGSSKTSGFNYVELDILVGKKIVSWAADLQRIMDSFFYCYFN